MLRRTVALCAALAALPRASQADLPPEAEVTLAGEARADALRAALRELLSRLGVTVRFRDLAVVDSREVLAQPRRDEVIARVWIELIDAARARVFLVNAAGDRVYVRTIPLAQGFDEVARETLAHMVGDAVDALLHGAVIGVHRDTLPAPDVAPPSPPSPALPLVLPPPPPPATWRATAGLRGDAQLRGPMRALGASLTLGALRESSAWRVGARVSYQLRSVDTLRDTALPVAPIEHALRLVASVERRVATRVWLTASLGGGVDVVTHDVFAVDGTATRASFATPVLRAEVGVTAVITRGLSFIAAVGSELDLDATRYVARQGGRDFELVTPWTMRPGASLGVELWLP